MRKTKKIFTIIFLMFLIILLLGFLKNLKQDSPPTQGSEMLLRGNHEITLSHEGLERRYLVHIPQNYDGEKTSLVLVLHGGASNAEEIKERSEYDSISNRENFIVVYPEATGKTTFGKLAGAWNVGYRGGGQGYENNIDDVGYIKKVIEDISKKTNIDEKKIYATGISMGGMMSYQLACKLSNTISAIAPIGASLTTESCNPSDTVSVLHFHGTKDKFIPYNGGDSDDSLPKFLVIGRDYLSAEESVQTFKDLNNCEETAKISLQKNDVTCETYSSCDNNEEVTLCTIQEGGHTWPGSEPALEAILGKTTETISATERSWDFFERH